MMISQQPRVHEKDKCEECVFFFSANERWRAQGNFGKEEEGKGNWK